MTQNKVMKLWTAFVTAFLALCTALGLITTTAAAAVPQAEATRNSAPSLTLPAMSHRTWPTSRALPPTMKQRIRAEAHGSSPSCRHRPPADDVMADISALCGPQTLTKADTELATEPIAPLQR
ncbi:hypothetical protein GCM10011579_037360 [Streptomyces albiflavescens]|uniref:Secreted protein n=1 Tax=Streptomyces albiflavescens TaxID=1623582 RepID=A0A917Y3B9_9ACTN|nr:DUF6344 domain-containing protein [Streptomyces albiflavescens]GGN66117.1 hypothetical protein GCM10011579_037360 [Streptomyces albiflavescens]